VSRKEQSSAHCKGKVIILNSSAEKEKARLQEVGQP
jgi:hypothetical protein